MTTDPDVSADPESLNTVVVQCHGVVELMTCRQSAQTYSLPAKRRVNARTHLRIVLSSQVLIPVTTACVRRLPVVRLPNRYISETRDNWSTDSLNFEFTMLPLRRTCNHRLSVSTK